MGYVLLIVLAMHNPNGVSISTSTVEFPTMETCEKAAAMVNENIKQVKATLCMSRGEEV